MSHAAQASIQRISCQPCRQVVAKWLPPKGYEKEIQTLCWCFWQVHVHAHCGIWHFNTHKLLMLISCFSLSLTCAAGSHSPSQVHVHARCGQWQSHTSFPRRSLVSLCPLHVLLGLTLLPRYMYMPIVAAEHSDGFTFRRYQLSDDKCFANFFHPEKHRILTLVQNFMEKGGKFAIAGYPHKLGFLLHGPPGTGKTSFIKALAQMTGRDILNVPLSRINTNQELMDLMFTQKVKVSQPQPCQ